MAGISSVPFTATKLILTTATITNAMCVRYRCKMFITSIQQVAVRRSITLMVKLSTQANTIRLNCMVVVLSLQCGDKHKHSQRWTITFTSRIKSEEYLAVSSQLQLITFNQLHRFGRVQKKRWSATLITFRRLVLNQHRVVAKLSSCASWIVLTKCNTRKFVMR